MLKKRKEDIPPLIVGLEKVIERK